MTHHGTVNVHESRLKYFYRSQVSISASTSERKKNEIEILGKVGKFPKLSGKIWENMGNSPEIWENLGKSGKKSGKNRFSQIFGKKSGISLVLVLLEVH